ncbi:MAG TPA: DUF1461 domain-containing protein [Candidatus Nanoarchaeia archaeon]|nr:DUF1461 domain-containing protein [Candidatus Nanoarchaeia archaeon]
MDKKVIRTVFSLFLVIFLLLFSYTTTVFFIEKTPSQQQTIDYLYGRGELPSDYTALEKSHLEDVKNVMKYTDYLFYISLAIITLLLTYFRKDKQELHHLLWIGSMSTMVSVALILLLALLFFDQLFTAFHLLFFPQGNWTFPYNSLLIRTFPLQFFMKIGRMIFMEALGIGVIVFLISRRMKQLKS